ncbi:molybdate ABC transporter substrate-binding protein [Sphingomonas montanisoli]|uniref:Molybdate ABC transporter substrate-binding protein n=1 Tax=Sphingomonas montanisoli TaxID=2606412 RepID=A0A5D9CD89_9SPHN|nr:molybdate ABC transporter substrate-binding protein [Sphingomonas montanisoli]TZG28075.1 molybdate ABC transporter substrate-binding protein [Sphingomonas montanisoli]
MAKPPLIFAAASLQESMNAAADAWAARGHERPVISFAGSSTLARQIAAGAPADVFVSADEEWMDDVAKKGLIRPGTRNSFLTNRLVLIAPADSTQRLRIARNFPLLRALGDGKLAMADTEAVPAGKYGKAALTALGVWSGIAPHVARADNVRAALLLVDRGAALLGIVYATDARAAPGVRVVGVFPAHSHPPITYPIALVAASQNREAEGFRRFLLSSAGRAIFTRYGFGTR